MAAQSIKLSLPELSSRRESAAALRVSLRVIDYMIQRRELGIVRIGGRVFVPVSELNRVIALGTRESLAV